MNFGVRLRFGCCLFVTVLSLLSCVSTAKRSLAERYYNIATDYYKDKNYKQAVAYYELAQKEDKNLKIIYLNYGLALLEVGNYQQAERQLTSVYAVDKRNTLCLSALGYLNFRAQKYEEAANWYRRSVAINFYNPQTFYNLGVVEQYLGNYESSQKSFDKIAKLQDPKEEPGELRRLAALNYLHLGAGEKAMDSYGEYFAKKGSNAQVFQDVYDFYRATEQYDKIIETFTLFEKSLSTNATAAFLLAELYYLDRDEPALGLENLKKAVERKFGDSERLEALLKKLTGKVQQQAQEIVAGSKKS